MLNLRSELKNLNRLLIKIGSNVLTNDAGQIDDGYISSLADNIAKVIKEF